MHLTSLMGPFSWPQPRRMPAYVMPIRTARFLDREWGLHIDGGGAGIGGDGIGIREDRRMRVTPWHCVHWIARSPGVTTRLVLQYLQRTVDEYLPPKFMVYAGAGSCLKDAFSWLPCCPHVLPLLPIYIANESLLPDTYVIDSIGSDLCMGHLSGRTWHILPCPTLSTYYFRNG
jgi:hypothetical protein